MRRWASHHGHCRRVDEWVGVYMGRLAGRQAGRQAGRLHPTWWFQIILFVSPPSSPLPTPLPHPLPPPSPSPPGKHAPDRIVLLPFDLSAGSSALKEAVGEATCAFGALVPEGEEGYEEGEWEDKDTPGGVDLLVLNAAAPRPVSGRCYWVLPNG